jgi:hypothetical protein
MDGGLKKVEAESGAPAQFGFAHLPRRPLPPLGAAGPWALSRAAVDRWAGKAKAGDEIVYCRGERLIPSDGVRALQAMFDAGAVTFKTRKVSPHDTAFIAERLAGGSPPAAGQRLARRAPPPEDADEIAMLMAVLRRHATRQLPCPTNRELGEQLGEMLGGPALEPDRVTYLLRKQISVGKIAVDVLAKGRRVVTIKATGQRTRSVA